MFVPKLYKVEDLSEIKAFVAANGFAILVNQANNRSWATHIPLVLTNNNVGEDVLQGHISKANPQWKFFDENQEILSIFQGPHTYISSSWYDHENVPTWNYMAVHIYGHLKILTEEALWQSLKKLTDKYEAASQNPVSLEKMSPEYLKREMRGIVGFEIKITEVQAAYKLSQNRDEKNHQNIINELEKRTDAASHEIAKAMKQQKK